MKKINPFLWFDDNADEAVKLYTSLFEDSSIGRVSHYGDSGPGPAGRVMTIDFRLANRDFTALNGGPVFKFTPAVSFFVSCPSEQRLEALWEGLSKSGEVLMDLGTYPFSEKFGWVADSFGLSWQLNLAGSKEEIAPCLMFVGDQYGKAESAIGQYTSIFNNSRVERLERYGQGEGGTVGTVKHARFALDNVDFVAMDGAGPHKFGFTPAVSFFVDCAGQAEVDEFWHRLSDGGKPGQCGWLEDRYGLSWQVVPSILGELLSGPDGARAGRVVEAMLKMTKLDVAVLENA